jgi:hypothetical protein
MEYAGVGACNEDDYNFKLFMDILWVLNLGLAAVINYIS